MARPSNDLPGETELAVLRELLDGERSASDIAESLDVDISTAYRRLKSLEERGFVAQVGERSGTTRSYKLYEATEFARLFGVVEGAILDETVALTPDKKAILSVWKIPQPEFHPPLFTFLFAPHGEDYYSKIKAVAVYGSVARGEARPDSDIDVLVVCDDDVNPEDIYAKSFSTGSVLEGFGDKRVISQEWFTREEFAEGLKAGSEFLENALSEAIVIYDPENVIQNARKTSAS